MWRKCLDQLARLCSGPGWVGMEAWIRQLLLQRETLKLNIWRRKARWPNGSTAPGDTREGSGGAVLGSEKAGSRFFWGGVQLPDHIFRRCHSPCALCRAARLIRSCPSLVDGEQAQKSQWAFCGVFYNQARPCDSHQSNPLNGPMTCFCGTTLFNRDGNC